MRTLSLVCLVFAIANLTCTPVRAQGKLSTQVFSGIVSHVSNVNIKVTNPKTKQSLSFLVVPEFDQIFSPDGKTTYRMTAIKPGEYIRIYYDQRLLGQRRADRVLLFTQMNAAR